MSAPVNQLVCTTCGQEAITEEEKQACEALGLLVPYYGIDASVRFRGHISSDDYDGVDGKELTGIVYDIFFPKPKDISLGYLSHDYAVIYSVRSDAVLKGPDPSNVIGAPMKVPAKVTRHMNEHDQLLFTRDGSQSLGSDWSAGFPRGLFHKRVFSWSEWRKEVEDMNPKKPNIPKRLDALQALLVL
jgi:hypothetical protein